MIKIKKIVNIIVIWEVVINNYYYLINLINIFYFRI